MPERILIVETLDPTIAGDVGPDVPAGFELALADAWDEAGQLAAVAEADYLVVGGVPITARVIEAGKRLKLIQKLGVGVDKIDLAAAARCGVPVAISAGANAMAVAEATFMLMMAVSRQLIAADASLRAGEWARPKMYTGCYEIGEKTLGIVGLGNIGKRVARRAAAFEMPVVYYDKVRPAPAEEAALGVRFAPLDEVLAAADVLTIHVPWTRETHHLIDERALSLLKPSAILVNTARGEVVDEAALERALRAGRLRGAGLDVLQREPIRERRSLFELPNVVLSPHMAGMTRDTRGRMCRHAFANCLRVSRGEGIRPEDAIDLEAFQVVPAGR